MLYGLSFRKGVSHVFFYLFGFLMHQIFTIRQPKNTLNSQLPQSKNKADYFELVRNYQIHSRSRTCWKYNKNEYYFRMDAFLLVKQLLRGERLR